MIEKLHAGCLPVSYSDDAFSVCSKQTISVLLSLFIMDSLQEKGHPLIARRNRMINLYYKDKHDLKVTSVYLIDNVFYLKYHQ